MTNVAILIFMALHVLFTMGTLTVLSMSGAQNVSFGVGTEERPCSKTLEEVDHAKVTHCVGPLANFADLANRISSFGSEETPVQSPSIWDRAKSIFVGAFDLVTGAPGIVTGIFAGVVGFFWFGGYDPLLGPGTGFELVGLMLKVAGTGVIVILFSRFIPAIISLAQRFIPGR